MPDIGSTYSVVGRRNVRLGPDASTTQLKHTPCTAPSCWCVKASRKAGRVPQRVHVLMYRIIGTTGLLVLLLWGLGIAYTI